jgi:hypothetical protein
MFIEDFVLAHSALPPYLLKSSAFRFSQTFILRLCRRPSDQRHSRGNECWPFGKAQLFRK